MNNYFKKRIRLLTQNYHMASEDLEQCTNQLLCYHLLVFWSLTQMVTVYQKHKAW